jgi:adenylate kinase
MINLILFGPPGSGKGTQAEKLEEKYHLHHISTGDLFRNEIKNQSDLGIRAKAFIDKGNLVPDEITINMLKKKLESLNDGSGFLLDGFPRTEDQAKALDILMDSLGLPLTSLLALEVPQDEVVKRILNRGKTSGRSDDNDPEIIKNRFKTYEEVTCPVFRHYEKQGKTIRVDGVGAIDEIFDRLCVEIEKMQTLV